MTTTLVKSDEYKNKRKKEAKNETSGTAQLGFFEKNDPTPESSQKFHKMDTLETILKDTGKEINALLSKYAQILSERAAMDASYVEELEGILKEACSIENHLKLKRENLRHSFAAIAGPLQNEEGVSGK
ncbi:testis-expressed protein 12 [Pantherophis guttatus]|uniref:Testis-expressed protein 12 n=1 Tax=Pantherophis guttatus TaxID=94885 RepID=A0A6P9CPZ3_PANGU|nr:testis-expressed protein 12 [Pantherophis guttatus]